MCSKYSPGLWKRRCSILAALPTSIRVSHLYFSHFRKKSASRRRNLTASPRWEHCHYIFQRSWSTDRLDKGKKWTWFLLQYYFFLSLLEDEDRKYSSQHDFLVCSRKENIDLDHNMFFVSVLPSAGLFCWVHRAAGRLSSVLFSSPVHLLRQICFNSESSSCCHVSEMKENGTSNEENKCPLLIILHLLPRLACACHTFHYTKRLMETIFVHRFSRGTMPLRSIVKVRTRWKDRAPGAEFS